MPLARARACLVGTLLRMADEPPAANLKVLATGLAAAEAATNS